MRSWNRETKRSGQSSVEQRFTEVYGQEAKPAWLEASVVLEGGGGGGDLPDTPRGWEKYLGYLEFLAESEPAKKGLGWRQS